MELTQDLADLNTQIENLLLVDMLLIKVAYWFLCVMCLVFFIISLYKLIRRRWSSLFLVLLYASALTWSLFSLLALYAYSPAVANMLDAVKYVGIVPIPALLALHINLQVSYKRLRPFDIVFFLSIPVIFIFIICRELFFPHFFGLLPGASEMLLYLLLAFYTYAALALIRSYLLCFNVFYQMPSRARRSTRSTFISVFALTVLLLTSALWEILIVDLIPQGVVAAMLLPLATPLALAIIIYPLFDSMYIMPASDVIITSREFIMRGLNTTILVLNQKHRILDWNKKDWDAGFPLPRPIYREAYSAYLNRVLSQSTGRVSPHNPNVFIMTVNGSESHFLLREHEVGHKKKMLGYIVEVSEVTPVYTKLRYYEEIAHIDTLTGLHNRNAYIDYTQQVLTEENMPLLVLVGDLNKLKRINDVYGHLHGDDLIITAAKTINEAKPENAFLARVGGDEFVILVPNGSAEIAEQFINKVNALCGAIQFIESHTPNISWGYALMTSLDQIYNDVFAEADKMMYDYKKGRVEFTSSGILPKE